MDVPMKGSEPMSKNGWVVVLGDKGLTKDKLQSYCKACGLSTDGNRNELVSRLADYWSKKSAQILGAREKFRKMVLDYKGKAEWRSLVKRLGVDKNDQYIGQMADAAFDYAQKPQRATGVGETKSDTKSSRNRPRVQLLPPVPLDNVGKGRRSPAETPPLEDDRAPGIYPRFVFKADEEAPRLLMDYQVEAVDKITSFFRALPSGRGILCLPTGGGKTKTAVWYLINNCINRGQIVLWIAHRDELLNQAEAAFADHVHLCKSGKLTISRYDGNTKDLSGDVILLSRQTLAHDDSNRVTPSSIRRENKTGAQGVGMICYDEAHTTIATKSFRKLKQRFLDKNLPMLGLTATPIRSTDQGTLRLREVYGDAPIYFKEMLPLIQSKFLAQPVLEIATSVGSTVEELTKDEVEEARRKHEFTQSQLSKLAKSDTRNIDLVRFWQQNKDRFGKTLVFACNKDHAKSLAQLFSRRAGVQAEYVVDSLDKQTRRARIASFASAPSTEPRVLVNVNIMTEGMDIPSIQTVLLARPTLSEPLYLQMVGRGMRGPKAQGTDKMFLIDGAYNFDKHALSLAGEFFRREIAVRKTGQPLPRPRIPSTVLLSHLNAPLDALDLSAFHIAGVITWRTVEDIERGITVPEGSGDLARSICEKLASQKGMPESEGDLFSAFQVLSKQLLSRDKLEIGQLVEDCIESGTPPRWRPIRLEEIKEALEQIKAKRQDLLRSFNAIGTNPELVSVFYVQHGWVNDTEIPFKVFAQLWGRNLAEGLQDPTAPDSTA